MTYVAACLFEFVDSCFLFICVAFGHNDVAAGLSLWAIVFVWGLDVCDRLFLSMWKVVFVYLCWVLTYVAACLFLSLWTVVFCLFVWRLNICSRMFEFVGSCFCLLFCVGF